MLQHHGRRVPSRQHHGVRRQQPPRDDNAALRQGFERMNMDPSERRQESPGEIGDVVRPILESRVRCLLEALFQPTKHAFHHLLGVQELGFQLGPQVPQDRTRAEHFRLRAEDRGVFGIDLSLDPLCGLFEIAQDLIDGFLDPSSFLGDLMQFDAGALDVALEKVAIDEGRSNRQAGRYANTPHAQSPALVRVGPQANPPILAAALTAHGGYARLPVPFYC